MKPIINKYFYPILCLLTLFLTSFCFYVYKQNQTIKSDLDRISCLLNKTSPTYQSDSMVFYKQSFREGSYIRQLETNTSLFLWLIPVLIGLFALISFKAFYDRIDFITDSVSASVKASLELSNQISSEQLQSLRDHIATRDKDQDNKADKQTKDYEDLHHNASENMVELFHGLGNMYWDAGRLAFNLNNPSSGYFNCLIALNCGYKWHKSATLVKDKISAITSMGYVLDRLRLELYAIGDSRVVVSKLEELNVMSMYRDDDFKKVFVNIRQQVNNVRVNDNCEAIYRILGFGEISTLDKKE